MLRTNFHSCPLKRGKNCHSGLEPQKPPPPSAPDINLDMEDNNLHIQYFLIIKGNPVYCNCYMRPLREWASVRGVKLLGACAGPPHLSEEPLQAVVPLDLRCRSRGEMLKDEFEKDDESTGSIPPTAKPKQKVKCPVNCDCDVSVLQCTSNSSCFALLCTYSACKSQIFRLSSYNDWTVNIIGYQRYGRIKATVFFIFFYNRRKNSLYSTRPAPKPLFLILHSGFNPP